MSSFPPSERGPAPRIVLRFGKSQAERRVTRTTLGLLVVWMGVMLAVPNPRGLGPLGAGVILLASAILQRVRGWFVGRLQWFFALMLILIGAAGFIDKWHKVPWFAIGVIVAGLFIVYRAFTGPRWR